ncbi:MAG: YabP/YqfC family sporulation protein [Eisenbergiella sp.]
MSRNQKKGGINAAESSKTAKELLAETLRIPKDTVLGASIVTVTGNDQLLVENYRGILEYTSEYILLQGRTCRIRIGGKGLSIAYYTNEDMKIEGKISEVRYL